MGIKMAHNHQNIARTHVDVGAIVLEGADKSATIQYTEPHLSITPLEWKYGIHVDD